MIKNYFKIAVRTLYNNIAYSLINLLGLATGMTIALLAGLWVFDEFSYDKYFEDHQRIAVVMSTQTWNGETTTDESAAVPLADELKRRYADNFTSIVLLSEQADFIVASGNKKLNGTGIWAQSDFPKFFTLPMITGSHKSFEGRTSVLLSRTMAQSMFGQSDPTNATVWINNKFSLKVGGVFEDFPPNTRFNGIQIILPWENQENEGYGQTQWSNHHYQIFVKLNKNGDVDKISRKIKDITRPFIKTRSNEVMSLHPLDMARLYDKFENGHVSGGRIQYVKFFITVGIFVLLLACINFMNLSTARSEKRAKEIGIRKAIGSLRGQLIGQFLLESLLLVFLALILTILFTLVSLPFFNELSGKQISLPWKDIIFWLSLFAFTLFTGLISGSYPAFYLSSFKPVKVLKGKFSTGNSASLFRKILVIGQFTVSIGLIIGTIVIFRQIQYAKNRPSGYSGSNLITIKMNTPDLHGHYDALRKDLQQNGVEDMAESSSPITNVRNHIVSFDWRGRDPQHAPLIGLVSVTHDFGKTVKWNIKEGRDFSRDFPTDSADDGAFIINEAAVKLTGFENPVGEKIKFGDKEHIVLGVIQDMIMGSPYSPSYPTVFWLNYDWRTSFITLRLKSTMATRDAISAVGSVFKKYNPGSPFEYQFVDKQYAKKFFDEEQLGRLAMVFTILAVFISCLGLFGLSSFIAEQRTKEISLRKVLGASSYSIWKLLSGQFITFVIISFLVAAPITWYFLYKWLQKYEYRTEIAWWIFAIAGVGALFITLLTISFQVLKAIRLNPVKNLKQE